MDKITAGLKQQSVIEIGPTMEAARKQLDDQLAQPVSKQATLTAKIDELSVQRLDLGVGKIIGWIKLAGAAELRVDVASRRRHVCVPYPGASQSDGEF